MILSIFLIAVGLSMDVFAVSISSGIVIKNIRLGGALKIALMFGLFHVIMLMVGWLSGIGFKDYIQELDHLIGFGLLFIIGCKIVYEGLKTEKKKKQSNPANTWVLIILSIATSIDALVVGLSFALLDLLIVTTAIIIGGMVVVLSLAGVYIGNKIGHFFESKIEVAGGIILIGIGLKFLIEHLVYHI